MPINLRKSQFTVNGEPGLPESYPIPKNVDDLLFYIQRNLNKNTVVYTINKNDDGTINENYPVNVFWITYSADGSSEKLNTIQKKAYGYISTKINNTTFELRMKSYDKLRLFLNKKQDGSYTLVTKISEQNAILSNIYVFADELGIFPRVKYIELYGLSEENNFPIYQRIQIS